MDAPQPHAPAWRVLVLTSAGDELPVRVPCSAAVGELRGEWGRQRRRRAAQCGGRLRPLSPAPPPHSHTQTATIETRLASRTGAAATVARVFLLTRDSLAPPGAPPRRTLLLDDEAVADVLENGDCLHVDLEAAPGGGRKRPAPAVADTTPTGAVTPAAAPKRPRPAAEGPLSPAAAEGGGGGEPATTAPQAQPPARAAAPPPPPSPSSPLPYGLRPFDDYATPSDRCAAVRDAVRAAINDDAAARGGAPTRIVVYTQTAAPAWWPAELAWSRRWTSSANKMRRVYDAVVARGRGASGRPPPASRAPASAPPPPPPRAAPAPDTQPPVVAVNGNGGGESRAGSAAAPAQRGAAASPSPSGAAAASRSAAPPADKGSKPTASTSVAGSASKSSSPTGSPSSSGSDASTSSDTSSSSPSSSSEGTPSTSPSAAAAPRPPPVDTGPGILHNLLVAATGVGELVPTRAEVAATAAAAAAAAASGLPFGLHPLESYPSSRDARDALRDAVTAAVNAERARAGAPAVAPRAVFSKASKPEWWPLDAWDRKKWADAPKGGLKAVFDALMRLDGGGGGGSAAGTGTAV